MPARRILRFIVRRPLRLYGKKKTLVKLVDKIIDQESLRKLAVAIQFLVQDDDLLEHIGPPSSAFPFQAVLLWRIEACITCTFNPLRIKDSAFPVLNLDITLTLIKALTSMPVLVAFSTYP